MDKFQFRHKVRLKEYRDVSKLILRSNFTILAVITISMFIFGTFSFSREIVLGTILLTTILELISSYLAFQFRTAGLFSSKISENIPESYDFLQQNGLVEPVSVISEIPADKEKELPVDYHYIISEESGEDVYDFLEKYLHSDIRKNLITSTNTRFNILNQPRSDYELIVNLNRINDVRYINKFFETVNLKLVQNGIFICAVETYELRKKRILEKYPPFFNYLIYSFEFIFKRVLPKLNFTKRIYFFVTQGRNRVISKAETLGRLYSCGFNIIEEKQIDKLLYFVVKKVNRPVYDINPSYSSLISLERIGKDGKLINVYKFRTMHAYSEYLQHYVFENSSLQEGGKFMNDFRITTIGKIMRKLWIDELPMLVNVLRGDLKLVGVRPLSPHYFSLYTKELQDKRTRFKPGLIPPYYAEHPTPCSLEEIMANEMRYLLKYEKHPFATDFVYFFKAFYNILFHKARSG